MLGIIFTNLVEMIETTISYEMADEILEEANLSSDGIFTSVGHYPLEDVVEIVTLLSQKTEIPPDDLIFAFGKYLFVKLIEGHKHIVRPDADLFDLLAELDSNIHVEVLKLYPNATLPTFTVVKREKEMIDMIYQSPRQLETLASGLIHGGAEYFKTEVTVDMNVLETSPYRVQLTVKKLKRRENRTKQIFFT